MREVNDFDITTSATPIEMKAVFVDCRTIETGLKHGTLTVIIEDMPIEITTYRIDGEYLDARHPKEVRFTRSLKEDLARRDFTVNAMAYSEKEGLCDLFGGREDLERRLIRAVGDPKKRFSEDALRILRAFRFSSKLGFDIEEHTMKGICACLEGLSMVSAERIAKELEGILVGQNAYEALCLMKQSGVLFRLLPEAVLLAQISALSLNFEVRLAFLMLDADGEVLLSRLHALKLSNAQITAVTRLVRMANEGLPAANAKMVRRLMARAGGLFAPLMELLRARGMDTSLTEAIAAECRARGDCLAGKDLAINGGDLVALGKKGKEVGEMLDALLERVLDDPSLNTREVLLSLVDQIK
ncbi:MAG: polynucleotide adenylyltransferase [Clostridia bacterium]|nr:polynucleotide adenylyltransferase [Clostridia bacterium]